jgi:hypothetical protein
MQRFVLVLALGVAGLLGVPNDAWAGHRHSGAEVQIGFGRHGSWFEASYSSGHDRDRRESRDRCDNRDRCGSRDRCDAGRSSWDRHGQQACDQRGAASISRQVWVPATYRTVVVGYSRCGEPRYDRVRVPGYWDTAATDHRCGSSGASW